LNYEIPHIRHSEGNPEESDTQCHPEAIAKGSEMLRTCVLRTTAGAVGSFAWWLRMTQRMIHFVIQN